MTEPVKTKNKELLFLDGLRGLAALFVMVGHARLLLWEGYNDGYLKHPEAYSTFNKALMYFFSFFATRYGHQAVLFFFVLSGFVIHLKYARNLKTESHTKFDFWNYILRRIRRIYPPLIFALLLTFVLDYIGRSQGYQQYFIQEKESLINYPDFATTFNLKVFIGNLFFLNGTYLPVFGSDGPLWSLKFEWWFYVLYPLLFLINRKSPVRSLILITALFILSFFGKIWPVLLLRDVFSLMICWWFGVFLADCYHGRIGVKMKNLAWLTILVPLNYRKDFFSNEVLNELLYALGFLGSLSLCFFLKEKGFGLKALNKLKWLGDCSYTLYCTHFPILMLLGAYAKSKTGSPPITFTWMIAGMIISVILAYGFHFITEKPFTTKRKISASE